MASWLSEEPIVPEAERCGDPLVGHGLLPNGWDRPHDIRCTRRVGHDEGELNWRHLNARYGVTW